MINPLTQFRNSLYKKVRILNKTVEFDPYIQVNSLNKIDILSKVFKSVDGISILDFDTVKDYIQEGLSKEEAIKQEIGSWDSNLINTLIDCYTKLKKETDKINFKDFPNLRIYWKIRKIFSKEEVDSWTEIEWNWAVYNIYEDMLEQDKFDDRQLEKRKPWYNTDLFNHLVKEKSIRESEKQSEENLIKKFIKEQNPNLTDIELDIVEAEENDIPTIIEE